MCYNKTTIFLILFLYWLSFNHSKFIEKYGPGIHHVCFEVKNIKAAIKELKENNIYVLTDNYSIGAEGLKVVFIHTRSTGGVLVELAEKPG